MEKKVPEYIETPPKPKKKIDGLIEYKSATIFVFPNIKRKEI